MITIKEFMISNPFTLSAEDTLADARQMMTDKHIRHIPVADSDQHLLGLVSQRDVLKATGDQVADNIKLSEIMIRDVSVINEKDSLRRAAIFLQEQKFGCLPVVSGDTLVGIITDSDFIGIAINLLEQVEVTEEAGDFAEDDDLDDVEMPVLEEDVSTSG